jgi:hypothetical protein
VSWLPSCEVLNAFQLDLGLSRRKVSKGWLDRLTGLASTEAEATSDRGGSLEQRVGFDPGLPQVYSVVWERKEAALGDQGGQRQGRQQGAWSEWGRGLQRAVAGGKLDQGKSFVNHSCIG